MENEIKNSGKGFVIFLICLAIAVIAYVAYWGYQNIQEHKEFEKQWETDNNVDIHCINDSTYHINLGDGSSCFTMKRFNDSLKIEMINVAIAMIKDDTITIVSTSNSAVWQHSYRFAYHDFFDDPVPDRSKVEFIHDSGRQKIGETIYYSDSGSVAYLQKLK